MTSFRSIVVCVFLVSLSLQATAATEDLGLFDGDNTVTTKSFVFSPGVNLSLLPGQPVDANVLFEIVFNSGGSQATTSVGAFSLNLLNIVGVDDVSATLSGGSISGSIDLDLTTTTAGTALSFSGPLSAGNYTLAFDGTIPASRTGGGSITGSISVSAVPIPAAIWLFGSALVAVFGVKRRTASA